MSFGGFDGNTFNNPGSGQNNNNFDLIICQIGFIPGHRANKCKNRFNPGFVPQKYYGRGGFKPTYGQNGKGFGPRPFPGNGRGFNGQFNGRGYDYKTTSYQGNMIYSYVIASNTYYVPSQSSQSHHFSPPQPSDHLMIARPKAKIFKPKTFLAALLAEPTEPASVAQALAYPKWFNAMKEEFNSLQANQTWSLVQPSTPVKVIDNKWVFRIK